MCNTVIMEVISEARKMRSGVGHGDFVHWQLYCSGERIAQKGRGHGLGIAL